MKWWLWLLLGVIVFAVGWQGWRGRDKLIGEPVNQIVKGERQMAPGFEGGGSWLNIEETTLAEILADGKVKAVLVDFWTYSCINCQRTIPYLKSWWEKYKDKGLVIVGVHSPEFEFEKETENVKMAIAKYGVGWPVVQDNDMAIWRAYKNNYWPRKYLINKQGKIVYDHIGEGAYEETERKIQEVIEVSEVSEVTKEPAAGGMGFGMPFGDAQGKQMTPELYLNKRGQASGHLGKGMDKAELIGEWQVEDDFSEAKAGAKLKLEFQAGEMNLVMSIPDQKERQVRVVIDGKEHKELIIKDNDLYNLWTGEFGRHTLEMEIDGGVRVHAFTFGK